MRGLLPLFVALAIVTGSIPNGSLNAPIQGVTTKQPARSTEEVAAQAAASFPAPYLEGGAATAIGPDTLDEAPASPGDARDTAGEANLISIPILPAAGEGPLVATRGDAKGATGAIDLVYIPDFRPPDQVQRTSSNAAQRQSSSPLNSNKTAPIGSNIATPALPNRVPALAIPSSSAASLLPGGASAKLVPDSEVVYGPAYAGFDTASIAAKFPGYLNHYQETVDGDSLSGPEIVQLIAERYSVGPRILLTVLEMQGGWVTRTPTAGTALVYPIGLQNPLRTGLYKQLAWAADQINEGYYSQVYGTVQSMTFRNGQRRAVSPGLNPGTVAIQVMLAAVSTPDGWEDLIGANGFRSVYQKLFGDPLLVVDPVVPKDLRQPVMRLPWQDGHLWFFTGGPHGGWASGSSWAAVDFAPSGSAGSCLPSPDWVVATAPGRVVRAEHGRVMVNLEGSSFQGRGWAVMYMHIATAGRVATGTALRTGDWIGHPSCEGGVSESGHLHLARLYNGQWIAAADRSTPMVLSGWFVQGANHEYEGSMARDGVAHLALDAPAPSRNGITADAGK